MNAVDGSILLVKQSDLQLPTLQTSPRVSQNVWTWHREKHHSFTSRILQEGQRVGLTAVACCHLCMNAPPYRRRPADGMDS